MVRRRGVERRTARTPVIAFILLIPMIQFMASGCSPAVPKNRLPEPILEENHELLDLYWEAWNLINQARMRGNRTNLFPSKYLNPEDKNVIDQWSTLSMSLFSMYGYREYPVMESLDLFYRKQRSDGFIARAYITHSGDPLHLPTLLDPMIHPPLFAWAELKYFALSADTARLQRVFPVLEKYFRWIDQFCRGKYEAGDLYYTTPTGSGMMNLPRGDIESGGWTDLSAQMALFADQMKQIAVILNMPEKRQYYNRKYSEISTSIRSKLWLPDSSFFYDITREGKIAGIRTIVGFWPLLAGIPDQTDAANLIEHLKDSSDFRLIHMFPSVSIRELEYDPRGFYWRGGVWGITNYMIIQGLLRYGQVDFAREAARNHLNNMMSVYREFDIDTDGESPESNNELIGKIWELYAPEEPGPGTRWDAKNFCQPDHVSFSGHGPISMLIENILGFSADAPNDALYWRITRSDRHGIRHFSFGDNILSVWTEPQPERPELLSIQGSTDSDIDLTIIPVCMQRTGRTEADSFAVHFDPGPVAVSFIPQNYIIKDRFGR
ncbi:MAG: trehalase family glycosidase [Candidatus Marinimicrobia bacterium]|nr:trehalase family glycosidase [Candidatus Neomarinimicrobiota bacterium]